MSKTAGQFDAVIAKCKDLFVKKMQDYGPSWRILRPESLTDQLFIKASRIRSLEVKKEAKVDEGVVPEFMGIVNYGLMGVIQLREGYSETVDMDKQRALELYEQCAEEAKQLMLAKNHDYDEAWRKMRVSSYTDLILMKINRTKEIEDHHGATLVSEGIDANYLDMVNYAIFALIRLTLPNEQND
ncbi:MAG: DUF1599 domain-containing protein [Paludibacteraceae bacterium]|nr:DUF1599 domain-containing protein [Paludibacteraceae bacterium]